MRRENSELSATLIKKLEQIKDLIDDIIRPARSTSQVPQLKAATRRSRVTSHNGEIDFSMPIRPFVKKYAGNMSGPKKFALVLADISGGDVSKKVPLDEIEKQWSRMTAKGLLGVKFNRFYSGKAKDNDWVHTEKSGLYHLRPSWQSIFHEEQ